MKQIKLHAGDLRVTILTWGAVVQDVRLAGVDHNLTCGRDDPTDYTGKWCYHGSLIGPVINRISTARVKIDGMMHELERNLYGRMFLHSGKDGTQHQNWTVVAQSADAVTLEITLPDGMCGLPGNRVVQATYRVTAPACLTLDITGTSDEQTIMNFANHSYWNLDGTENWTGHQLQVTADAYLPGTVDGCPTGEIVDVTGTLMDLRQARPITAAQDNFDNNFCLSTTRQPLRDVATLTGTSGVSMTVATTETGIQIYDGGGNPTPFEGLAIEAQSWPDATNHRGFPSIKLAANDTYHQTTSWRFNR
jgi:aldose 1-epimerase